MAHPLLVTAATDQPPEPYLAAHGQIFARFDARSQDSGNVSYGVALGGERFFVKTAGDPADPRPYLAHAERTAWLENAVRLSQSCDHPALPRLRQVIRSPQGPLLVYDWAEGELLGVPKPRRSDPQSSYQRFRNLPSGEILTVLDTIYDLHRTLAQLGWVAADFYDGCLIYDFATQQLQVVDLDMYRRGPFRNEMGRMFGSSRFMAPEEFAFGALIDQRTTVFTMGRAAAVLLSDGTLDRAPFRGSAALHTVTRRACAPLPEERFPSVDAFHQTWQAARRGKRS